MPFTVLSESMRKSTLISFMYVLIPAFGIRTGELVYKIFYLKNLFILFDQRKSGELMDSISQSSREIMKNSLLTDRRKKKHNIIKKQAFKRISVRKVFCVIVFFVSKIESRPNVYNQKNQFSEHGETDLSEFFQLDSCFSVFQ